MLEVVFRKRAEEDLRQIQAWFEEVAPHSIDRIFADIYRSLDRLRENPESAQLVEGKT